MARLISHAEPREAVHSHMFGMVLQDTWLFEGTVRDNLVLNNENVADEKLVAACKACGIHSFIEALPDGYDTVLNDNTSISAGTETAFNNCKGNDTEQSHVKYQMKQHQVLTQEQKY